MRLFMDFRIRKWSRQGALGKRGQRKQVKPEDLENPNEFNGQPSFGKGEPGGVERVQKQVVWREPRS